MAGMQIEWAVVTDRECGLRRWAKLEGFESHQLAYVNADTFSRNAQQFFHGLACDDVLLFYSRRVASPLIDEVRVCNIHPALLPAFPGLHAVEHAISAGVRILGATLHRVDSGLDTGPILAQVATALSTDTSIKHAQHLSYLQKVWLTLLWFEYLSKGCLTKLVSPLASQAVFFSCPGIADERLTVSYLDWLAREECHAHDST
jgi:phosphoribosylglycinamide formyltransferase 1